MPQNFVDKVSGVYSVWLNGVDLTCNVALGGAQTVVQAQTVLEINPNLLGLTLPVPLASGGTGS